MTASSGESKRTHPLITIIGCLLVLIAFVGMMLLLAWIQHG
jgi:hypothetical protein